jgi:hypothetical protein
MGEVLEHVEQPFAMMKQIYKLLDEHGLAFITTVINAPTIDHIYLFETIESVLNMAKEAGFQVIEYRCETAGGIKLEKAIKKKQAITIAMFLGK